MSAALAVVQFDPYWFTGYGLLFICTLGTHLFVTRLLLNYKFLD